MQTSVVALGSRPALRSRASGTTTERPHKGRATTIGGCDLPPGDILQNAAILELGASEAAALMELARDRARLDIRTVDSDQAGRAASEPPPVQQGHLRGATNLRRGSDRPRPAAAFSAAGARSRPLPA